MSKVICWHFARIVDGKPVMRDGREIVIGKGYRSKRAALCECGYHGSLRVADAIRYAPGFWVSRRELWGKGLDGDDKLVRTHCRHLIGADAHDEILLWVADVAEDTMRVTGTTDERSLAVPNVIRAFVAGNATQNEMDTAYAAAYAAADAAAYAAGRAVADAAYAVADAAYAVARAADAAYAVARAADACDNAHDKYSAWLEERLHKLLGIIG